MRAAISAPGNRRGTLPASRDGSLASVPSGEDRLAIVKIEFHLHPPLWIAAFSLGHPDLLLMVHLVQPARGRQLLVDVEIFGPPNDWVQEIANLRGVQEVRHLGVAPDLGRYRVQHAASGPATLMLKLGMLMRFPITVQNGLVSGEVVDRVSQIRGFVASLRASGYDARIVSLRHQSLRSRQPNLTPVQREIFQQAVAAGYFQVPRRITLTRLAEMLSRSKSSVSETLAVVERKLAESASGSSV